MDELAAQDLGPENEEQLARLRRALILGTGFQILFLEISNQNLAKEVLRRLRAWSGHDGVPPLAIVRTRPGRDPVASLQHMSAGAVLIGIDRVFDLPGLDRGLVTVDDGGPDARDDAPAETLVERTMTTLNWNRDQLPLLVDGPLVLMLTPDGLRQLFVHAPDLLAWRAHTTRITLPRPIDLQIRPRPSRRASLEEKAWLEQMIASSASDARGLLARELPGWLIRLGEIEAREGGPWQQCFARAEELAAGRREILFKVELARVRHAFDEERHEDAGAHISKAMAYVATASDNKEDGLESMLETMGWGAAAREIWTRVAVNEILMVVAEHTLRTGDAESASNLAESALLGARTFDDRAFVIAALGVAGTVTSHRGDAAAASARFDELRRLARDAQDRAAELFALTHLIELAPDVSDARRLYLQAMWLMEPEDHEARARVSLELSRLELPVNPDEAERVLSQIEVAQLTPKTRIQILASRGSVAMTRGHHAAALVAARSAWDDPQRPQLPSRTQAIIGVILGSSALLAGDRAAARDAFGRLAEIAEILADRNLAEIARVGLAAADGPPEAASGTPEAAGGTPEAPGEPA
ncbi:MAG TPA: hypothetical protein VNO30_13185 [Kofleriaceae bacterium]|nr:hypothetical protein [Kofleriaceae bacterium]